MRSAFRFRFRADDGVAGDGDGYGCGGESGCGGDGQCAVFNLRSSAGTLSPSLPLRDFLDFLDFDDLVDFVDFDDFEDFEDFEDLVDSMDFPLRWLFRDDTVSTVDAAETLDATEHALDASEGVPLRDPPDASSAASGADKNCDDPLLEDDPDAVRLCSFRFLLDFFFRFDFDFDF